MPERTPRMPRNPSNPVGHARMVQQTAARLKRGLRDVRRYVLETLKEIPKREVTLASNVGRYAINESRYEYLIDVSELDRIVAEIRRRLGVNVPPDYMVQQAVLAYEAGTGTAAAQLAALTDEYTREITQVLSSEPWQRRVALMRSRVFEQMEMFNGDTATELGRILSEGVENGLNPRVVARDLEKRFGISRRRAERIARTEITGALRRATRDETIEAEERLGIKTRMLHFSALSPSTRRDHGLRHGKTYTVQEVAEWYAVDANAINCKCSQQPVLVDEDGNPMLGSMEPRMVKQRGIFKDKKGL